MRRMLAYNEVLPKKLVLVDGEPYEVISAWVFRKQQRKPVNQTKLRNLKTGSTVEQTFHVSDKVEEAEVETRPAIYIYNRSSRTGGNEWWFHEMNDKSKRFPLYHKQKRGARQIPPPNNQGKNTWVLGGHIPVPFF